MTYPNRIMKVLRQRNGLDENDTSADYEIQQTPKEDALREVCAWNLGSPDWADTFMSWANECGVISDDDYNKFIKA